MPKSDIEARAVMKPIKEILINNVTDEPEAFSQWKAYRKINLEYLDKLKDKMKIILL